MLTENEVKEDMRAIGQDLPEVLSMGEAAKLLRIGASSIYEVARQPGFPAYRIGRGRRLFVRKDRLLAWLAEQEAAGWERR